MRTTPFDLPGTTFSTLSAWLSNSSGVASLLTTVIVCRLPAATFSSDGVKLWSLIVSVKSSACASAGTSRAEATVQATRSFFMGRPFCDNDGSTLTNASKPVDATAIFFSLIIPI